jgi:hypothetical protein
LPFNSDVFENLSRGVYVLDHQKDPLTKKFTELAENMIATIDQAMEASQNFGNEPSSQAIGEHHISPSHL